MKIETFVFDFKKNNKTQAMTKKSSIENGWIFSPSLDFLVFIGISLGVIGLSYALEIKFFDIKSFLLWIIVSQYLFSYGHVFGSAYPILTLLKSGKLNLSSCLLVVSCVYGFCLILSNLANSYFLTFMALSLMWHYIRQNVGWIHISSKRANERSCRLDEFMTYSVCGLPFLHYLANPDIAYKTSYSDGDLNILEIFSSYSSVFMIFFWGNILFYLIYQFYLFRRGEKINLGKYTILLSGFFCFYVPYAVLPDHNLYWAPNLFVHALSYSLFTYYHSKANAYSPPQKSFFPLKGLWIHLLFLTFLGYIWFKVAKFEFYNDLGLGWWGTHILIPLSWSIALLHFIIDAYIWKHRFLQIPGGHQYQTESP